MNAKLVPALGGRAPAAWRRRGLPMLLALGLGAAACGPKHAAEKAPAKEPAYVFPHSTHVDADVACTACHPMDKATKLEAGVRHVKLPASPSKQKACSDCHDTDPVLKVPARTRAFRFTFSHADHLPRVKGDCKKCHATQPEPGSTEAATPPMSACTSCHNHQRDFAEARCTPCHVDLKYYKPETAFAHEGDWLRAHGGLAKPSAETCAACHDQTYCAECHSPATAAGRPSIVFPEKVERSFIHRGDYVSRHMIEAGANPARCSRCHGTAFCDSCHTAQGVSRTAAIRRDPHPAGFFAVHGDAARRDISACATCHEQAEHDTGTQFCVTCHSGAAGVNPHPAKFLSTHDRGDIEKNSMCKTCHGP